MTAEQKIWTLATSDPTLQQYFGAGAAARVFDRRMPPNRLGGPGGGTCLAFQRISTSSLFDQYGRGNLAAPMFQFTIRDFDAAEARAARDAVIQWLGTVSFSENSEFLSPPTTPPHFPNFTLNIRSGMDADIQGVKGAVYSESIDVRLWNLED